VLDLIEAIEAFIGEWNGNPQPFVWRARDGRWRISSPVARFARQASQIHSMYSCLSIMNATSA
jgi:hypothetical protein